MNRAQSGIDLNPEEVNRLYSKTFDQHQQIHSKLKTTNIKLGKEGEMQ